MAYIPCEMASDRAVERIIKVLRAKLADEAATLPALGGNKLPIPPDVAYLRLATEGDIATVLNAHNAALFVVPSGAVEQMEPRSGNPDKFARLDRSAWRVILLFKVTNAHESLDVEGYKLLATEVTYKRAQWIKSAMMMTLLKYAINEDDIHHIEIITHFADYSVINNTNLTGRAVLELEVWQDVEVPQPIYGVVP